MSFRQFAGAGRSFMALISAAAGQSRVFTCTSTTSAEPMPTNVERPERRRGPGAGVPCRLEDRHAPVLIPAALGFGVHRTGSKTFSSVRVFTFCLNDVKGTCLMQG